MLRILLPTALTLLLLVSACGPLIELEDENTALRSTLDSLEIVLAECRGQGDLLQERLAAIENENLQLDDRNRELTARMAELQYAAPGDLTLDPDAPAVSDAPTHAPTDVPAAVSASPAASGGPAPAYDGKTSPGIPFLQKYQHALNTYNGKRYEEALGLFSALIADSGPNDMTDNCVYWMGEAAVQLNQTDRAIAFFTSVIGYKGADKVDDALLSRAAAYIRQGRTEEGRADLDCLLRDFPRSEHTGMARQMLRAVR